MYHRMCDVARRLGVSRQRVLQLVHAGKLSLTPGFPVPLITEEEVRRYEASRLSSPPPVPVSSPPATRPVISKPVIKQLVHTVVAQDAEESEEEVKSADEWSSYL